MCLIYILTGMRQHTALLNKLLCLHLHMQYFTSSKFSQRMNNDLCSLAMLGSRGGGGGAKGPDSPGKSQSYRFPKEYGS